MAVSFSESAMKPRKNLLLVDGLNLAFRYLHAKSKNWAADYLRTVSSLASSYEARKVVIATDAGSSFRKQIDPQYKANRQAIRDKQTEEEANNFREFLEEFNKALTLAADSYLVLKYDGVEADDIIAYISLLELPFEHKWIVSSDKDLDQLVDDSTSRFSYITRKEITKAEWGTHYDYPLEHHISIKVLMGDSGDNVPGVEGVGIKRAAALVKEYGSALDIHERLPLDGKQKFIANLNSFGDRLITNYELMDLREFCATALGAENIASLHDSLRSYL